MSASSVYVRIVHEAIDLVALQTKIDDPDVGAQGWFCGVTRRRTERPTQSVTITESLSYEAHEPMAILQLRELAENAVARFELARVVIVHRLGDVPIGEASVVVGCSSAHRVNTFGALPWIMDTLKQDVPIWKRESFVDGTTQWVHPTNEETK